MTAHEMYLDQDRYLQEPDPGTVVCQVSSCPKRTVDGVLCADHLREQEAAS